MRAAFIGAGSLTVMTARQLLGSGHEVIIIDRDKDRITALAENLDCGFLHGDGSRPAIQRELVVEKTDVLFCLTGSDETNILASLVGRSLGFGRVVTKIDDPEFEHVCLELGLEYTIIPARTTGRHLADLLEGQDPLELSTMIRDEARVISFVVSNGQRGPVSDLPMPDQARVVCIYREGRLTVPAVDTELLARDEVVMITHRDQVARLRERLSTDGWTAQPREAHS